MKVITLLVALSMMCVIDSPAQSIRQLERKAKKTFKREAYGMALYYSQAILRLDAEHNRAINWSKKCSQALNLHSEPLDIYNPASAITLAIALPDKKEKPELSSKGNNDKTVTLVVQTFNELDSSALYGTYVGVTNDGFGEGRFVQNTTTTNQAAFEIPLGVFYTITGTKNLYSSGSATLPANILTDVDTIYSRLYLSPAFGLPVQLYFDHNEPKGLMPQDTMTDLTYEDTWLSYLYRIDEYIDSNTVSEEMVDKAKAQTIVGLFFANQVDASFHQLAPFCELLETYLSAGKKVSIVLEGYSGTLEKEEAKALVTRRLKTVENYFLYCKNGLFKPWLSSGQLSFKNTYQIAVDTAVEEVGSKMLLRFAKERKVVLKTIDIE